MKKVEKKNLMSGEFKSARLINAKGRFLMTKCGVWGFHLIFTGFHWKLRYYNIDSLSIPVNTIQTSKELGGKIKLD